MATNNPLDNIYNSLNSHSQSYFADLIGYSRASNSAPKRMSRILHMRDLARFGKADYSLNTLPNQLNAVDKQMNLSIADSEKHVGSRSDLVRINHFMEGEYQQATQNNNLAKEFLQAHVSAPDSLRKSANQLNNAEHRQTEDPEHEAYMRSLEKEVEDSPEPDNQPNNPPQQNPQDREAYLRSLDEEADNAPEPQDNQGAPEDVDEATHKPNANPQGRKQSNYQPSDNRKTGHSQSADKKNPYLPKNSDAEVISRRRAMGTYRMLSQQGRRYFLTNLKYAQKDPIAWYKVRHAKSADLTLPQKEAMFNLKVQANGFYFHKGHLQGDSSAKLSDFNKKNIDNFFNSRGGMSAIHNKTISTDIDDFKHREKFQKAQKNYNARQPGARENAMKQGMSLYEQLSPAGQTLFMKNAEIAQHNPDRFHDFKMNSTANLPLSPSQRKLSENLQDIVEGKRWSKPAHSKVAHDNLKVSSSEQGGIDYYFKQLETPYVAEGLNRQVHDYNNNHYVNGNPDNASSLTKTTPTTDYLHKDRTKYDNMIKHGDKMYDSLSPQGRQYLATASREATINLGDFNKAMNSEPKALTHEQAIMRKTLTRTSGWGRTGNGAPIALHSGDDKFRAVPSAEKKQIDKYLTNEVTQEGLARGDTYNSLINHDTQRINTDYLHKDHAKYASMISHGNKMYDNLSPQGQKYLATASKEATINLDDFNKAMKGDPKTLTRNQARFRHDLVRASGWGRTDSGNPIALHANDSSKFSPVPSAEKEQIDKYLSNGVTQEGLARGDTYNNLINHEKPKVQTDYLHREFGSYVNMLNDGANMYDDLSPQGRRYLFTASKEANNNFDDYNKAMKGDPKTLTRNQANIRRNLSRASGWGRTDDGREMQLNPSTDGQSKKSSVPAQEKRQIDEYLNNPITREGLARGDTYNTILLRNIKNRQLEETRDDEDNTAKGKNKTEVGKAIGTMAHQAKRQHPLCYAIGAGMAGVEDQFVYSHSFNNVRGYVQNELTDIKKKYAPWYTPTDVERGDKAVIKSNGNYVLDPYKKLALEQGQDTTLTGEPVNDEASNNTDNTQNTSGTDDGHNHSQNTQSGTTDGKQHVSKATADKERQKKRKKSKEKTHTKSKSKSKSGFSATKAWLKKQSKRVHRVRQHGLNSMFGHHHGHGHSQGPER